MTFVADFDPAVHDGLILVHPGYSPRSITDEYVENLATAVERAKESGRLVFYAPSEEEDDRVASLLRHPEVVVVRHFMGWCWHVKRKYVRKRAQREVDFVAARIGRSPSQIRLGFGGMYADGCVDAYAVAWCREVVTRWPDTDRDFVKWRPKRPFARGDVLERLVIA